MRRVFAAAGSLASLLSSGAALAQPQPFVAPTPGTRIFMSTGSSYEVDSVSGTTIRAISNRLTLVPWLAACRDLSSNVDFDAEGADALWPLQAGKAAKSETRRGENRWMIDLRIKGTERITVPAGTFDTWLIEIDETAASHSYKATIQCWYAPEVGFTVRRRQQILVGNVGQNSVEIVRIEKKDRSRSSEFRSPPPGTTFDTSRGSSRIDGAEGTTLFRKSDDPKLNSLWAGGIYDIQRDDPFAVKITSDFTRLWPLEVGKKISFEHNRPSGGVLTYNVSVDRVETTKVPAGLYSAFVIKMQVQAVNGSFATAHTYWWSPALGFPVKHEAQFIRGSAVRQNYELRAVKPP